MAIQILSLFFLIFAIVLGFFKKTNIGFVAFGCVLILSTIGGLKASVVLACFPEKLFITLLGTMFFFCLLQQNQTLELLSRKMVVAVGKQAWLIPIIIYLVSWGLSAAGPGAISVQSVMIIFAVSLAVQMNASPVLLGSMAILGAVGGTTSPIALSGIIVTDITNSLGYHGVAQPVFIAVSIVNFICAMLLYVGFKGYALNAGNFNSIPQLPKFNKKQTISIVAIVALIVVVVGLRYDVGLVAFTLSLLLILCEAVDEKSAVKLIPWNVLILICGVSVLMSVTSLLGGIDLLSHFLSSLMNDKTASPLIGLTAGIMSWFSSANGVVLPTLIPTVPGIVNNIGGGISLPELVMAIVGGATVAGISPLSTGGSLILATYAQEAKVSDNALQSIFSRLFLLSFGVVVVVMIFAGVNGFKLFVTGV